MNWQGAVQKSVSGLGFELVDCERGPRGLLRIFIDRMDGRSVTIDDCEAVSRQLQYVLEVEGAAYERLEISSPGLDRPLKTPADYRRFAGQEIALTLKTPFQGRKRYRGVLQAQGEAWRVVFHEGRGEQALDFALDEVREARLVPVIDFKGRSAATVADHVDTPTPANVDEGGAIQ